MEVERKTRDMYEYGFGFMFWVSWGPLRTPFSDHFVDGEYHHILEAEEEEQLLSLIPEGFPAKDYETLPGLERYSFFYGKGRSKVPGVMAVSLKNVVITEWPDFTQMLGCVNYTLAFVEIMERYHGPPKTTEAEMNVDGFYYAIYDLGDEFHEFIYILSGNRAYLIHYYDQMLYRAFHREEFLYLRRQLRTSLDTKKAFRKFFDTEPLWNDYKYGRQYTRYWKTIPSKEEMKAYLGAVVWPYFEERPEAEALSSFIQSIR